MLGYWITRILLYIPFVLNQSWEFFIILVLGTYLKLELNNSVMDNIERQIIMPIRCKICVTEICQTCISLWV
jgi:hypothetical protein